MADPQKKFDPNAPITDVPFDPNAPISDVPVSPPPAGPAADAATGNKPAPTTYSQESIAAIGNLMTTLLKLPQQMMTPHETFGATREQEVQYGPLGRLLYNIPADTLQSLMTAEKARQAAAARGEHGAAQTLAYLENSLAGPFVKTAEAAGSGYAPGKEPPVGQWRFGYNVGPQTVGATIEGAGTIEAPKLATELAVKPFEYAKPYVQAKTGTGERMTEVSLAKATGEFNRAKEDVATRNAAAQQKYAEGTQEAQGAQAAAEQKYQAKIAEIDRLNQEQQHGFQMRGVLERQIDADSVALKNEITKTEHEVWQEANRRMDAVKPQGNPTSNSAGLISKVKDIQKNVLQSIPENVKEFNRILDMDQVTNQATNYREQIAQQAFGQAYDELPTQKAPGSPPEALSAKDYVDREVSRITGAAPSYEPLTWEKLQSLKSRIDTRLSNTENMNADLYRGLRQAQESVLDEMGNLLKQSGGSVADWEAARKFYREFREDFHDLQGREGSASPVAKARHAVDPARIRKPFSGDVQSTLGNRGVNTLRKYKQWGGDAAANRVEKIIADQKAQSTLPKQYKPQPHPERPPEAGPGKPFVAEPAPQAPTVDIETQRWNKMRDEFAAWRKMNKSEARTFGLLGLPEHFSAWILDRPSVLQWAKKLTPADWAHLDNAPPEVRDAAVKVINNLAEKEFNEAEAAATKRGPWKQLGWYKGPKPGIASLDPKLLQYMATAGLTIGALGAAGQGEGRESRQDQESLKDVTRDYQTQELDRQIEARTAKQREERKRSPGQQIRDLRKIQEKHSDNPNMPIGPGQ